MFGIIKNKAKNHTPFSVQMYRHDMRSLMIAAAVIVYLWADSVKWCVRLGGEYLFWAVALSVPSVFSGGALIFFIFKPHSHPVYKQFLKYFKTIAEGALAIDVAFYGMSMSFLRGRMFVSGIWAVEKSPFFSRLKQASDIKDRESGSDTG